MKGAYLASFLSLLKNIKFLVDRFHVVGHTERCCQPPTIHDPGKGCYHPLNESFAEIRDANTECAEQCFKWLNKYKTIVRNMKQHRFFIPLLICIIHLEKHNLKNQEICDLFLILCHLIRSMHDYNLCFVHYYVNIHV